MIQSQTGVSHRDDVHIFLGIEAGVADNDQHSLVRSAAKAAYGELPAFELPDRTDLGFCHQKIRIVPNNSRQDLGRRPADDSADAGGDGCNVMKVPANQGGNQNVGPGADEFNFQALCCVEAFVDGQIIRQLC